MIEPRRHALRSLLATALLLLAPCRAPAEDEIAEAADAPAAAAPAGTASISDAAKPRPAPFSREAAEMRRSHGRTGRTFLGEDRGANKAPASTHEPAAPAAGAAATRPVAPVPSTRPVAPASDAIPAASADPGAKAEIQNLGEGDQKLSLVRHDGTWSMHAENVNTDNIARLWHQAGGPEITMKLPVDRPFTMSVHKLSAERLIERLYVGYSYTLHYDDQQHLIAARIYSPRQSAAYKTPRLTESLGKWKEIEADPGSIPPGGMGDEAEPDVAAPAEEPAGAPQAEQPAEP